MTRTYILLGRTGDILGILPLLYRDFQAGNKSRLMVAAECASVLDGVSYVEPVVYQGPHYEMDKAMEQAKALGGEIVCCQVKGPTDAVLRNTYKPAGQTAAMTTSFQKEAWKVAGAISDWDKLLPLVFDKRDAEREAKLVATYLTKDTKKSKKTILVSTCGISSPFPYKDLLLRLLQLAFSKNYNILELPMADRIYDLLALYEQAHCLIAADSAPLHLAWACRKLPVFALTNDRPLLWNGAAWRPNHHWYCRYHDFPERAVEMLDAIQSLHVYQADASILTVWSEYENPRMIRGWISELPITRGIVVRDSANVLQDTKRVPFLRDVLKLAFQKADNDGTVIFVTRPDVKIDPHEITVNPPCYSYRIADTKEGKEFKPIVDAFAATKAWWKKVLPEIPDLLLSTDYFWSQCLWAIFKTHGAHDGTGMTARTETEPKPFVATKTFQHNERLCMQFMATSKVHSRYPKIEEQLECLPLETSKLHPFGYNPTIIDHEDKILMCYRYHRPQRLDSMLAVARIGEDGKVLSDLELPFDESCSREDARFFRHDDRTHMSLVESNYPRTPISAVVKRGTFLHNEIKDIVQDEFSDNNGKSIQKNWVYFEGGGVLNCIYKCSPLHSIFTWAASSEYYEHAPRWPYGEIRGGTTPIEYEGQYLRFFHSRLWNDMGPIKWRYYVGAYLMEMKPPFAVTRVSRKPILYGSEVDSLTKEQRAACHHRKQNVVFPAGVVERDGHFLISVGINDSACALVKIKPNELNL